MRPSHKGEIHVGSFLAFLKSPLGDVLIQQHYSSAQANQKKQFRAEIGLQSVYGKRDGLVPKEKQYSNKIAGWLSLSRAHAEYHVPEQKHRGDLQREDGWVHDK